VSPAAQPGGGWQGFLAAAQAKVGLRMWLNGSRALEESPDRLHIGLESEIAEQTLRPQIGLLGELAASAYGGARRIELSVVRAAENAAAPATGAARTRDLDARAR